jgi:hypothetical protein
MNGKSLCENFNMLMYTEPVWKPIQKSKWRTPRGMSYTGQFSAHVANARTKVFGTLPKAEFAMMSEQQGPRMSPRQIWKVAKNEDKAGENPYVGGFKEVSQKFIGRNIDNPAYDTMHSKPFRSAIHSESMQSQKLHVSSLASYNSVQMANLVLKKKDADDQGPDQFCIKDFNTVGAT